MQRGLEELTVADLERLLNARRAQLSGLYEKREQLRTELDRIDRDIAILEGGGPVSGSVPLPRKRERMKNEKSLRAYVLEELEKSRDGFTLYDLHDRILAAGYRSASANFRNILYQCLYNTKDVYHDEPTGTYRLKALQSHDGGR